MKTLISFIIIFFISAGSVFCEEEDLRVEVIKLKYADAEEMLPVVEHMLSADGKVTADPNSQTLIVVDHPQDLGRVSATIDQLDVPQKQVDITVVVAEVTDRFLREIGMPYGQAVIPPEKFKEIQYLLSKSEDSSIRSQMMVKTFSGQPAAIKVSQEELFGGTVRAAGDGSVIVYTPTTTRSAGSFLEVLPRVNNDGTITISVRPSVSKFLSERTKYEQTVLTQVIVNNGDTVALGGVDAVRQHARQKGIPFTGISIPLESSDEAKRIVMFLTATVSG